MSVQGIKSITRALAKQKKTTGKALRKGLFRGGLFLQRESQKIVPVDKSFLKASAFTWADGGDGIDVNTSVIVGFGMEYAVFVHENLEARHKPGKQAKFLEQPAREKQKQIGRVVIDTMKKDMR